MHSNTIGTLIMNAINMQEIENIAELLWEAIYSGNKINPSNKSRGLFLLNPKSYQPLYKIKIINILSIFFAPTEKAIYNQTNEHNLL
jgi:hypothetical protein